MDFGGPLVLTALVGAAFTAFITWAQRALRGPAPSEGMQERVDRLTRTLRDAMRALAATSEELQHEVDRGQQLVTKLEADAHTYEELAKVNRAQAEAVAILVRSELATEGRRSLWNSSE
jgi:predicted phage tail protein